MAHFLSKVARKMGLLGVRITVVRFSRGKVRIIQSVFPSDDWESILPEEEQGPALEKDQW
ncbi:uncharacterized protein N7473_013226 [Penicillium subrubescens]|uniref:uncharacterized protein n=1 Tax=Penicillium subrubescens TaxID=1316194 RepID=UPI002545A6AC|nr:uncharacterized protein N7473_013226 [Penicillium subrubescens]KAJ5873667.1 hypothetical protein N7473_013226 [Penicillium subrubescens]